MALTKWDPFAELNALHEQLNNLFSDNFSQLQPLQAAPATDIYSEDDKQLTVEVQLPNFKEEELSVAVHQNALEIKAEHTEKEEDKSKRKYIVRESASSFYRRIALPKQADEENISAHFKNGVLKVTVPFKELPQPKKVAISSGKTHKENKKIEK